MVFLSNHLNLIQFLGILTFTSYTIPALKEAVPPFKNNNPICSKTLWQNLARNSGQQITMSFLLSIFQLLCLPIFLFQESNCQSLSFLWVALP